MTVIHKRLPHKFQVLIWFLAFAVLTENSLAGEDKKSSSEILSIIQTAAKKEDFAAELKQIAQKKSKAIPTLITVFQDGNRVWQERWFSGIALSKYPQNEEVKKVLVRGTDDPLSIIRSVSVQALAVFDDDESLAAIQKRLETDTSLLVRSTAVKSLGKRKDRNSADLLEKELFHTRNYYRGEPLLGIRETIVQAMGEIGSLKSIDPLMKIMSEKPGKLQNIACVSLEKIVQPEDKPKDRSCPDYWLTWFKNQSAQAQTSKP